VLEPKSDFSIYYIECCGGAFDGLKHVLPDEIIDQGIEHVMFDRCLYRVTDNLIAPNVYRATFVKVV
jgi:hypothetical protein